MSQQPKFLIVCLRRIGDVLLSTPLAASIRATHPGAKIHWLVFESTASILRDNPAADEVLIYSDRPTKRETLGIARRIFMSYDFAISVQSGDRPAWMARVAATRAYGIASQSRGGRIRNALMTSVSHYVGKLHRREQILRLASMLGLTRSETVLTPRPRALSEVMPVLPYWVLQPGAAFRYKRWNEVSWRQLVIYLRARGKVVLVSGGGSPEETHYLDQVFQGLEVTRLDGKLNWNELVTILLKAEGFVGVDTSTTHLAAALNIPVFAIFGPTDPALWAPKSNGAESSVRVIQNKTIACVPCQLEGCDRHIGSASQCLELLPLSALTAQIENTFTDKLS